MDLPALMAGLSLPDDLSYAVGKLLARKAAGDEHDLTPRIDEIDRFVSDVLSKPIGKPMPANSQHVTARADRIFASFVLA